MRWLLLFVGKGLSKMNHEKKFLALKWRELRYFSIFTRFLFVRLPARAYPKVNGQFL
jgi:hypothetical protein